MREILFRGKRFKDGEWVEGSLLIDDTFVDPKKWRHNIIGRNERCATEKWFVITETVGQFTGLTDKNGKKVFEGDIVWFEDESPSNYEYHDCTEMRCGVIEYGDNCFYITDRIVVEMEDLIYDGKLDVEVIGNIHDNPELLKEGANNG